MKQRVLLVGGKNKAKSLSESLTKKGYEVTIINKNYEDCEKLAENDLVSVIFGDGTKPHILEEAKARSIDIVISLMKNDEDNLVVCELCKKKFQIGKSVSLLSDPQKTNFFHKMGVDNVICDLSAITNIIEQQALMDKISKVTPIVEGVLEMVEVKITRNDIAYNKKIWEMNLPREVIIACILRESETVVPSGDTVILAEDTLVLITKKEQKKLAFMKLKGSDVLW